MGQRQSSRNYSCRQHPCCRSLGLTAQKYFDRCNVLTDTSHRDARAEISKVRAKESLLNARRMPDKKVARPKDLEVAMRSICASLFTVDEAQDGKGAPGAISQDSVHADSAKNMRSDFIEGLKAHPEKREELARLGDIELARGNELNAIVAYHYALGSGKDIFSPEILINMGIAKYRAGEFEESVGYFTDALEKNPCSFEARFNRGIVRYEMALQNADSQTKERLFVDARHDFEAALAIRPLSDAAHYQLGLTLKALGDLESAAESFREAYELAGDLKLRAIIECGRCHEMMGKLSDALRNYLTASELDPSNPDACLYSGRALLFLGYHIGAIGFLEDSYRLNPSNPEVVFLIGVCMYESGNLGASLEFFREAVSLDRDFAEAHYGVALLLFHMQDFLGAFNSYSLALELKPHIVYDGRFERLARLN